MISMHLVHVQASNTHIHATIEQQATRQQQSDTAFKAHTPGPPCRHITRALASRKSTPSCRTRRSSAQGRRPQRAAAPAREVTVHCHPALCRAAPSLRPPHNGSPAHLLAHAGLVLSAARRVGPGSHARTPRCRAARRRSHRKPHCHRRCSPNPARHHSSHRCPTSLVAQHHHSAAVDLAVKHGPAGPNRHCWTACSSRARPRPTTALCAYK
jgi:hypothetical protein